MKHRGVEYYIAQGELESSRNLIKPKFAVGNGERTPQRKISDVACPATKFAASQLATSLVFGMSPNGCTKRTCRAL